MLLPLLSLPFVGASVVQTLTGGERLSRMMEERLGERLYPTDLFLRERVGQQLRIFHDTTIETLQLLSPSDLGTLRDDLERELAAHREKADLLARLADLVRQAASLSPNTLAVTFVDKWVSCKSTAQGSFLETLMAALLDASRSRLVAGILPTCMPRQSPLLYMQLYRVGLFRAALSDDIAYLGALSARNELLHCMARCDTLREQSVEAIVETVIFERVQMLLRNHGG